MESSMGSIPAAVASEPEPAETKAEPIAGPAAAVAEVEKKAAAKKPASKPKAKAKPKPKAKVEAKPKRAIKKRVVKSVPKKRKVRAAKKRGPGRPRKVPATPARTGVAVTSATVRLIKSYRARLEKKTGKRVSLAAAVEHAMKRVK